MKKTILALALGGVSALAIACSEEPRMMGTNPPSGRSDGGTTPDGGGGNDTTAPTITSVSPADMATGVALNSGIRASFDEPVSCSSVTMTTMLVTAGGNQVAGNLACTNSPNGTLAFTPAGQLAADTQHTVNILPEVKDLAGNTLAAPYTWRFTTGSTADTTPPVDPAITAPSPVPATTTADRLTASGTKEAGANVEARWLLDGAQQNDFQEVVAIDQATTWTYDFPLSAGANQYVLRSRDAAGNVSCGGGGQSPACNVSFTITRMAMMGMVNPPTVTYAAQTDAPQQVVTGTKPANTAIEIDGNEVVRLSAATTWYAELDHAAGANSFQVVARDGSGNRSTPVTVDVTYTPGAPVNQAADLEVQFELSDMWNELGDEFRINNTKREIGVYGTTMWLEGPLARLSDNGTPNDTSDDTYEPCVFDEATHERRYTRYAVTLNFNTYGNDDGSFGDLYGHWGEPNFFVSNYFAAIVEGGVYANTSRPIARDLDRRDPMGRTWWWEPGDGACPPNRIAMGQFCPPRMVGIGTPIDVITEASVHPRYDNQGRATLGEGTQPGQWTTGLLTYPRRQGDDPQGKRPPVRNTRAWDWTDHGRAPLEKGAYLLTALFVLDRSDPHTQAPGGAGATPPYQWLKVLDTDYETCWDNPAHDRIGNHRAEAIVVFGDQDWTIYADEKGPTDETADACHNAREGVRCSGADACDWNGNRNFGDDPACMPPASNAGANIRYTVPQNGWPKPIRIRYCANGPCP